MTEYQWYDWLCFSQFYRREEKERHAFYQSSFRETKNVIQEDKVFMIQWKESLWSETRLKEQDKLKNGTQNFIACPNVHFID